MDREGIRTALVLDADFDRRDIEIIPAAPLGPGQAGGSAA
jgi:hypothetical protein